MSLDWQKYIEINRLSAAQQPVEAQLHSCARVVRRERPQTWVTGRTGHMGYTFHLFRREGVDAVEECSVMDERLPVCRTASGWRADDGGLPGVGTGPARSPVCRETAFASPAGQSASAYPLGVETASHAIRKNVQRTERRT